MQIKKFVLEIEYMLPYPKGDHGAVQVEVQTDNKKNRK
jgi:hypothetical protein